MNFLFTCLALLIISLTNVVAQIDCQVQYDNATERVQESKECVNSVANNHANNKQKTQALKTKNALTDRATFIENSLLSNNFGTHAMGDLSSQTINNTARFEAYFAMDYNQTATVLYALYAPDETDRYLVTIDTTSGAVTSMIGEFSDSLVSNEEPTGLTINSADVCYVSATNGTQSTLYRCDLSSGALTVIGSQSTAPFVQAIEASCDDVIYAHDTSTDSFYTLNPSDGSATLLGAHGLDARFAQSLTFDHEADVLYAYLFTGTLFNGRNTYAQVNITDGSITAINVDNPLGLFIGASQTSCVAAPSGTPTSVPTLSIKSILGLMLLIAFFATWGLRHQLDKSRGMFG